VHSVLTVSGVLLAERGPNGFPERTITCHGSLVKHFFVRGLFLWWALG